MPRKNCLVEITDSSLKVF